MFRFISIAFLLFLFQNTSLFGQSYITNHFTVKDGLPSNAIRSINEDAQGNLWIVTDNGVVKYNGNIFKTYNSFNNIKISSVFDVYPASDGRVYLTDYVKNLDYIYNDQLHTINTGDLHVRLAYEKYGQVFGVDGLGKAYSIKGDSLINIPATVSKAVWAKLISEHDSLPYVIVAYPYVVKVEDRKFTAIHMATARMVSATYPQFDGVITDGLSSIYKSKLYFTVADKRFVCYDPERNSFYTVALNDKNSLAYIGRQIMFSDRGIQLTTNNGSLILDEWLRPIDSLRINVQQEGIIAIFQDVARNFWLLTNSGLKGIGSYFRNMKIYSMSDNQSIAHFNDQLYIIRQDGNVSVYDTAMKFRKEIVLEDALKGSHSPVFYSILQRPDSLIITTDKNITVIKKDGNHHSLKLSAAKVEMLKPVKDVIYYKDDLIVLTYEGICKTNVQGAYLEYNKIGRFNKILTGTNDSLFVCDNNSMYYVNNDVILPFSKVMTNTVNRVVFPYSNPFIDTIRKVTNFTIPDFLASDENHWIAASNRHIFTWNKFTRKINRYNVTSKVGFLKIEKNNLWVGTSSMLYRFTKNSTGEYVLHSKYYNFGYNLYQNIRDITSTVSTFFISTDRGVVRVPIADTQGDDDIRLNVPAIRKIAYGKDHYYHNNRDTIYRFDYTSSNLSINFSANTVGYDKDVTYRSYLEGVDRQWQTTNSPTVTYSALGPGTYRLHFKVSLDKYGLHSKEQVVTLTIRPLWWQNTILRVVVALVILVALGFILVRLSLRRKNQMLRKAMIEKSISNVKLSALQSQMNPHFIFNAMASIQSFVRQKRNDLAEESLTEFATLIRLYLEFSRKPLISLEEELHTLLLYTSIEMKRFDNKFDVDFDVKTERPHTEILLPPLIIQPYVENAISHGLYHKLNGRGRLDIVITEKAGEVEVIVDDNGIGRDKANSINGGMKRGTSRGLQLINERIKILNETGMIDVKINILDKTDAGGQPEGTKITIHFKTNTHYDQGTNS